MEILREVVIRDIPLRWSTNLRNSEIRDVYAVMAEDPEFDLCNSELKGASFVLRFYNRCIPYREGECRCIGFTGNMVAVYRTALEWEIHDARVAEVEELKEEQQETYRRQVAQFRGEMRFLLQSSRVAMAEGDFALADVHLQTLLAFRHANRHLFHGHEWDPEIGGEVLRGYAGFPTASNGISFLRSALAVSFYFMVFSDLYWELNAQDSPVKLKQIRSIHDAAVDSFPSDGVVFKHICLFWRRNSCYAEAIRYCQEAVNRGLRDGTKTGFSGRLRRLQMEWERHQVQPKEVPGRSIF